MEYCVVQDFFGAWTQTKNRPGSMRRVRRMYGLADCVSRSIFAPYLSAR
jgi:hypothetical protein